MHDAIGLRTRVVSDRHRGKCVAANDHDVGYFIMFAYALWCCCRKPRGANYQRDRDRTRMLLLMAACALYVSTLAYLSEESAQWSPDTLGAIMSASVHPPTSSQ
jgi:hypothetical protein